MERENIGSQIPAGNNSVVPLPGMPEAIDTRPHARRHYDSDHPSVRAKNNELVHPIIQTSANTLGEVPGVEVEDLLQEAQAGYAKEIQQLGPKAIENEWSIKIGAMFAKAASELVKRVAEERLAEISKPDVRPNEEILALQIAMDHLDPVQRDILETYTHEEGASKSRLRYLAIKHGISTRTVKQYYNDACTAVAKYMEAPTENVHYLPLNDISNEHPESE